MQQKRAITKIGLRPPRAVAFIRRKYWKSAKAVEMESQEYKIQKPSI